jgi:hypothetical protein
MFAARSRNEKLKLGQVPETWFVRASLPNHVTRRSAQARRDKPTFTVETSHQPAVADQYLAAVLNRINRDQPGLIVGVPFWRLKMKDVFRQFARMAAEAVGSPAAFLLGV